MANNEITPAQLTKLVNVVKKHGVGISAPNAARESGLSLQQTYSNLFQAELMADPSLAIKPTAKNVANAVDQGLYRWPRLAVYAGISVSQAKKLYTEATGKMPPSNITGRGRQFDGVKIKPKAQAASGRRGAAAKKDEKPQGTSGRRGAAQKSKANTPAPAGQRGRRGTRAGANPR